MKKINGFAIWTVAASVLIFFGAISFSACQNELLDSPSFQNRGSYSTGRVAAPTNLTATQGGFRSITIKWTAAKSAVFYNIYHSDTATGNFTFLEQTPDATCSYTVGGLEPDVKKYYKVQSVDSNSETSEGYSQICYGTTLAAPIITSIKQNANGDQITVHWYKGVNCTEETYLNSGLNYTVILYNADGTQVLKEETIPALDKNNEVNTKYTFKNLTPNTNYYIQIKAYTKSAQDAKSTESSDIESQSTAHSLIPAAPENFEAAKGISKDGIALSWVLPKFAEIKASTTYETRPVYFKVFRKLESAPETAYDPVLTYLGTTATDKIEKNAVHFVKTTTESGTEATVTMGASLAGSKPEDGTEIPSKIDVKIEYPEEPGAETDPNYPNYIPGTKITLTDKTASRGEKYSYRIQSFIDDNGKKNVTSDESWIDGTGWLINSPTVSVSSTYQKMKEDQTKIESFTVTLNFKFDDFGQPYNYVITETCQKMRKATEEEIEDGKEDQPEGNPETKLHITSSYPSIAQKEFSYTPLEDELYYQKYSYKVSICDPSSEDTSSAYYTVEASNSVIVINDMSRIPKIENFSINDGYKDKFIISWKYNKDYKYTLKWKNIDKNNNESDTQEEVLDNSVLETMLSEDNIVTFYHTANSGDRRKGYSLTANNGFEDTENYPDEVQTLGTPEPFFEPSYNSIKILWKPVQKAAKYEITADYSGKPISAENISEIKTDEDNNLYCEIIEPYGKADDETYNTTNAEISGQKINFKLESISKNKDNEEVDRASSPDNFKIFTLGPAAIEHTESVEGNPAVARGIAINGSDDSISLRWNKVEGAKGYLIFRRKYSENYYSDIKNQADVYYYSTETKSTTLIPDDGSKLPVSCNETAGVITFNDNYKQIEDYDNIYEMNQDQIAWGFPYGYTIIPVKNSSDFSINDDLSIHGKSNSIEYTQVSLNKIEKTGSTYGYGFALTASKGVSLKQVDLAWKDPHNETQKPTIYYREYNAEPGSVWKRGLAASNFDSTKIVPEISYKAYDYIAYYTPDPLETIKIRPYFEEYISKQKDSYEERLNKGYILALKEPKAEYAGNLNEDAKTDSYYYSERFSLSPYSKEEKKQGFDKAEIFMLNTNKKDGWTKIAELDPSDFSIKETLSNAEYDLNIEKPTNFDLILTPATIKNGGTNTKGLLQVLRDAKHYYMMKASRTFTDSEGKTKTLETSVGNDNSIFTYRRITDEELAKATMLNIAYSFYLENGGSENLSNIQDKFKYQEEIYIDKSTSKYKYITSGRTSFGKRSLISTLAWNPEVGKYEATVSIEDFSAKMLTPFGNYETFTSVSMKDVSTRTRGLSDSYIDKFRTENFSVTVENADPLIPLKYNATFAITCESENSLIIKKDGINIISTKDKNVRREWFPIQMDSDSNYWLKSSAYGWWED